MICTEQYAVQPDAVVVFPLGSCTDLILRKDIAETEAQAEDGEAAVVWTCTERQMRVPRALTAEDVAANFDTWWAYTGEPVEEEPEDPAAPTEAERLAAVEAALLELGEAFAETGETASGAADSIAALQEEIAALKQQLTQAAETQTDTAEATAAADQPEETPAETEAENG